MIERIGIHRPELLQLSGEDGRRYEGGNQEWYRGFFQRMGGCGPTNASTLVWYLARTRAHCEALCPSGPASRERFLSLMEAMWPYVTPGMKGVHRSGMFVEGVTRFGSDRGVPLDCAVLEVPPALGDRPSWPETQEFLTRMFDADLPVAFLNLDNGRVAHLDSWHWVTLIGLGPGDGRAVILDAGHAWEIELETWLRRSKQGGALVAAFPMGEEPD